MQSRTIAGATPNLSVNTDAPWAALRAGRGSPVTLVRSATQMAGDQQIAEAAQRHIERNFHALIKERAAAMNLFELLDLPTLEGISDSTETPEWFAVPGMYGGFAYWFDRSASELTLVSESWSRVVGGSGQRHAVTASGVTLVAEGFV